MIYVEVKEVNTTTGDVETVGTIGWDESGYVLNPPESPILKEILGETVRVPTAFDDFDVTSKDPEQFLGNLHRKYRGSYFWVTPLRRG